MKIITINPTDDPRRAEYWEDKEIQIPVNAFIDRFKSFISEAEDTEQIYEVSRIITAAYDGQFEPDGDYEPQMILGIGAIMVDGDGTVAGACYQLTIKTHDGTKLFTTSDGWGLQDDHYHVPLANPYDELWDPIGDEVDEFLKEIEEVSKIPMDDINYDINYISKGSKFTYNSQNNDLWPENGDDEFKSRKKGPKPGTKLPVPDSLTTLQLTNIGGFEAASTDLIIRLDVDGNFEAKSDEDWSDGDIARVLAQALVHIHSGNCHDHE